MRSDTAGRAGLAAPLLLLVLYAGLHLPLLWKRDFFAYHDTLELFEVFHINYANLVLHGEMADWLPYANYGMPGYLKHVVTFSPLTLLGLKLGAALGVTSSWPVFLATVAAEVAVFVLGLHALCRLFLSGSAATFVAGASFLLGSPLWWNYPFQLRIVYLLPAASWFLVRFFRTGRISALALAATLLVLSNWGESHYFVLMFLLYTVVVGVAFGVAYRRRVRPRLDRAAAVTVPLAVLCAAATLYVFATSLRYQSLVTVDRDPETLRVSLTTFLTYGGGGFEKVAEALVGTPVGTFDAFFHVTAPGLALAAYACWRERSREFLAIGAAFGVLLVFCFGSYSPLAYGLYFVPGMSYLRHIGLMYAFPRLLLAVMIAFGLDRLHADLADPERARATRIRLTAVTMTFGGATAVLCIAWRYRGIDLVMGGASLVAFLALALAALFVPVHRMRAAVVLLVVADGIVYLAAFAQIAYKPDGVDGSLDRVVESPFVERRPVDVKDHPRIALLHQLEMRGSVYTEVSMLLGMDPCVPVARVDSLTRGVAELARQRFGFNVTQRALEVTHRERPDDPFFRVMACDAAKLQLIEDFTERTLPATDRPPPLTEASPLVVERPETGERREVRVGGRRPAAATLREQGLAVIASSANHLSVRAAVRRPDGAWLTYADAYHPSWRADVDGEPIPVWRADLAIKAVRVPAGSHVVTFRFGDPVRRAVVWAAGLGAALLILVVTWRLAGGRAGAGRMD